MVLIVHTNNKAMTEYRIMAFFDFGFESRSPPGESGIIEVYRLEGEPPELRLGELDRLEPPELRLGAL